MPEIQIPSVVITGLQVLLAFSGAFLIALWLSLIVWTFRDARSRSRDIFAILLATLMVAIFGPLGVLLYFLLRPPNTLAEIYERSLEEEALLQDLEERPRCPGCSRQVNEEWIICPDCHTTLKNTCLTCEKSLNLAWTVCPFCGTQAGSPIEHHHPDDPPGQDAVATRTQPMVAPAPKPKAPVIDIEPQPFPPPTVRGDETQPQLPQTGPIQSAS